MQLNKPPKDVYFMTNTCYKMISTDMLICFEYTWRNNNKPTIDYANTAVYHSIIILLKKT